MKNQTSRRTRFKRLQSAWDAEHPSLTVALAEGFLEDYPDSWRAWVYLGDALTWIGRFDKGRRALQQALKRCPSASTHLVLYKMGGHYRDRGQYNRAAAWYRRAIAAAPQDASGCIFLGAVLARQGRFEEAETWHRKGTECVTGYRDEAFLNLALVLRSQGKYAEALNYVKKALQLDPKYECAKNALKDITATLRFLKRSAKG